MAKIATPDFIESLKRIANDISGFNAHQIYIRDTWDPIHSRLSALMGLAPNDMADHYVTNATFMTWELQRTRGPKHKEEVKQRLLSAIATAQYYARTYAPSPV